MQTYQTETSKSIPPPLPLCGGGGEALPDSPYFLIQGNKSQTAHSTGVCESISDFDTSAVQHPERLEKYARAHRRSVAMSTWISENTTTKDDKHLANMLKDCGDYLIFRNYYTKGEIRLHGMSSCKKHILCPLCAIRRGAKSVKAYLDRLEVIKQAHGQIKAYLVTFTIKNGEDLKERFHHLQSSMKRYNLKRSNHNANSKNKPVEGNKALGAVWSYEFKRGTGSDLWHPHAHAIWLCYEEPNEKILSAEWKEITGDSHVVNVTPFHDQSNVVNGFLEVFKYAVKFSTMPLEQNWEGYQVLNGRRLVASFGLFRGVEIPESLTDEPLDSLPFIEIFYRYLGGRYQVEKYKNVEGKILPF